MALNILIVSLGVLMFEVALTRVFSVMLSYHYVFIAVSVALLGLGVGAVFFRFIRARIPLEHSFSALSVLSLAFALSAPLATVLVLRIPYTDFLLVYYSIAFIPFFFAGMIFALAFDRFTEHSNKLYCASLLGSGVGPIAITLALEFLGGINAILLVGVISAIGAVVVAFAYMGRKLIASSLVGLLLLSAIFVTNLGGGYIGEVYSKSSDKELFTLLNDPEYNARIVRTYWSAYARTDLVELGDSPNVKYIFNDGGAGMQMFRFDGDNFDNISYLMATSAAFPFYFGNVENVLIIGPGGGKDVLISLMGGAKSITAVDVNPDVVEIVHEESEFNGGIHHRENVRWVMDEGRSFVKRSAEKYNVIMLMLVFTKSAREVVGYSLSESYVFTVEAFGDYFDHLTENGRLVVVAHNEEEAVKLFATGIVALDARGETVPEAARHAIILQEAAGHHALPAFILRKSPFSENESTEIHAMAHHLGFQPIYFPYVHEGEIFSPLLSGQMSLNEWASSMSFDASPNMDDSPFFYNYPERGLPTSLSSLFYGALALTIAFVIVAWLSLKSFVKHMRKTAGKQAKAMLWKVNPFSFILYFLLLGVGFMLIEVPLVQKFILFLGQPTLAFSALLLFLLVGGGLGSFFSDRFKGDLACRVVLVSLSIVVLAMIYTAALPYVFDRLLGQDIIIRLLITAVLLFPLGFLMGIPFPTGLRLFRQFFERDVGWMWGINGVASVLGSVLAVVIAILSGFTAALVLGAAIYFCVGLISRRFETLKMEAR